MIPGIDVGYLWTDDTSTPPPVTGLVQMTTQLQRIGWAGHLFLAWLLSR
jgi:hypothetical protein